VDAFRTLWVNFASGSRAAFSGVPVLLEDCPDFQPHDQVQSRRKQLGKADTYGTVIVLFPYVI
jgi:hypothetical protein